MVNHNKPTSATLPPAYNRVGKQPLFPATSHDENARANFLTSLHRYVDSVVLPGNKVAFERRVKPQFTAQTGRDFQSTGEVSSAMSHDPHHQLWGALSRLLLEMRQQAGRSTVLRQIDQLTDEARTHTNQRPQTLHLDSTVTIPTYLKAVDTHGLPGGFYTEYVKDDVSSAATYDAGLFVGHTGTQGPSSDGPGRALVAWMKQNYPDFAPTRILDLGSGPGNNTLPLAIGYPDAQITGIDVSAPMLRYSHARAVALNVPNVAFTQANAEQLPYADNSVDWVQTTFFLRETATAAINKIVNEIYRVLKPGGLMLHIDQLQYSPDVPLFEQYMRERQAYLANLPFSAVLYGIGIKKWMVSGGFAPDQLLQFSLAAVADNGEPARPTNQAIYLPLVSWNAFGAWKNEPPTNLQPTTV